MQLKIEPVKSEELSLLVSVSCKTFYDTFYKENSEEDMALFLRTSFSPEALQQELSLSTNFFFFAKADEEVAGYLKLTGGDSTEADNDVLEISRIYVVKEKLGFGVGKALMQFAITFARQNDKQQIKLGVWENNYKAIAFYKRFGFEKFDEHLFMVGNDPQTDWLMKMDLSLHPDF